MSLVVIGAKHPILGMVYRRYVYEGDVNAPDYYGYTTAIKLATAIKHNWHTSGNYTQMGHKFFRYVLECSGSREVGFGPEGEPELEGDLLTLQEQSGQSASEFIYWLQITPWEDLPAPQDAKGI